jgi:hypothetical protein
MALCAELMNAAASGQRQPAILGSTFARMKAAITYGHFRRGCWSVPCCCSPGDPPGGRSRLGLLRESVIPRRSKSAAYHYGRMTDTNHIHHYRLDVS